MGTDSYLDKLLEDFAKAKKEHMQGKTYAYKLNPLGYTVTETGRCRVIDVKYSSKLGCNVYTIRNLDSKKCRAACQFEIYLEEIA